MWTKRPKFFFGCFTSTTSFTFTSMPFPGKLMNETLENGKKTNFGPNLSPFGPYLSPQFLATSS